MSTLPVPIRDFMSAHATPDTDFLQLSSGELDALLEQLRYALDLMSDVICRSESHALWFRHIRKHGTLPPEDLEVLEEQALVSMEKGELAFSFIEEIQQALEDRNEYHVEHVLDELLASLETNKH